MNLKQIKFLFQFSALFNITVALTLLFATNLFIEIFNLGPAITQPVFVHLFAVVVLSFGCLYYYISTNPKACLKEMYFGMFAKLGVVVVCAIDTTLGLVFWTINIPVFFDLVFAYLFYKAANTLPK